CNRKEKTKRLSQVKTPVALKKKSTAKKVVKSVKKVVTGGKKSNSSDEGICVFRCGLIRAHNEEPAEIANQIDPRIRRFQLAGSGSPIKGVSHPLLRFLVVEVKKAAVHMLICFGNRSKNYKEFGNFH
ncbi:hypothetical protein U1Q18_038892, partial [Sarracenia purpurea var. burkii]